MRRRWDTLRDASEFVTALRDAPPASRDRAAIAAHGDTVTLVLAPNAGGPPRGGGPVAQSLSANAGARRGRGRRPAACR
jgi:hypothetical protein